MASRFFTFFCLAFILGNFVGRFFSIEIILTFLALAVIVGTLVQNKIGLVIFLSTVVLAVSSLYFQRTIRQSDTTVYFNKKIKFSGTVLDEPDQRLNKTYLVLSSVKLDNKEVGSKIQLTVPKYPEYFYGDKLTVVGKIQEPFESEEFSYKMYLKRFGIDGVVYYPLILDKEENNGNFFKKNLLKFKKNFISSLSTLLPEPENSFLGGILVGERNSIPESLTEKFNVTGTTHIIAISGFNITIIVQFLDWILRRFGKRVSFTLSLLGIFAFVVLTGASASVVRAGIMGALGLVALNIGRVYAITNALLFTAVVMLIHNPTILHFDVGFQLSFLALIGIVYIEPMIKPRFAWLFPPVRKYLTPTLSAQLATLPILLFNFGRLSIVSLLANILVLPVIPIIMMVGFLVGFISLFWQTLAVPIGWICWLFLKYVIVAIETCAKLPLASIQVNNFPFWLVLVYYLVLSLILWKLKPKNS